VLSEAVWVLNLSTIVVLGDALAEALAEGLAEGLAVTSSIIG